MMYFAILPVAFTVRASDVYEEQSQGIYQNDTVVGEDQEHDRKTYIMAHVRNRLSFDLWYKFLGGFIICTAEAKDIVDISDPAFAVFPILFEVVSAYGNVSRSFWGSRRA